MKSFSTGGYLLNDGKRLLLCLTPSDFHHIIIEDVSQIKVDDGYIKFHVYYPNMTSISIDNQYEYRGELLNLGPSEIEFYKEKLSSFDVPIIDPAMNKATVYDSDKGLLQEPIKTLVNCIPFGDDYTFKSYFGRIF